MAFKIKKNTLFIKDKNTQELKPIGLFGSGSDKTMEEIKTYADTVRSETESAITLKANITLESIPDEYSELQNTVNSLKEDIGSYVENYLKENPATDSSVKEWARKEFGSGLIVTEDGRLSVDTVNTVEENNMKPITSDAVYKVIGNIETALAAI